MNQAASATRRSPTDPSATAGCCPMFNAPFFGLASSAASGPQCVLRSQAQQLVQLAQRQPNQQQQHLNSVMPLQLPRTHQTTTVSQQHQRQQQQQQPSIIGRQLQQQHPQQPQQPAALSSQGSQDYTTSTNNSSNSNTTTTSTDYSTSAPSFSLQNLLAGRHPASSLALAAALASASFPHLQQQQIAQQQQHHHQHQQQSHRPPINQSTNTNTIAASTVSPLTSNSTTTPSNLANQVPIMNYNSYPSAQSFLNLPTINVQPTAQSQQVPPIAAHLGSNANQQQQQPQPTIIPNLMPTHLNLQASNSHRGIQQTRPLVTNTTLNSSIGQQQVPPYRSTIQASVTNMPQQQQSALSTPAQQLGHVTRNILSEEALNSLFNDQFQAFLLCQLVSSQQFAHPLATPATQAQQQVNASRPPPPPPTLPLANSGIGAPGPTGVVIPAQSIGAPAHPLTQQPQHQQQSEPVSDNSQRAFLSTPHSRSAQTTSTALVNNVMASNSLYQSQPQRNEIQPQQQQRSQVDLNLQQQIVLPPPPTLQPEPHQQQHQQQQHQQQQHQQQQPQQQQQQQPQTTLPPLPFYPLPQLEQALALLTNAPNTENIISQFLNLIHMHSFRNDAHSQHSHHPSHFHNLHGSHHHHHHHHHGPDGQPSGQDATIPLDSMAINETKPRGLTRHEIEKLGAYSHTDEKDNRTCVICLSKFELKAKIRPLSCQHAFHAKCVDKWLRANRTCPICRRDALATMTGKLKRII